jgi:VWFA-related protein
VFRSGTELVLVNVVVRDKAGNVVRNLTRDDFVVTEDDKPQVVTSFDFEELDKADVVETAAEAQTILPQRPAARPSDAAPVPAPRNMRGRRLLLFFDLSSMQPRSSARGQVSARVRGQAVAGGHDRRRVVFDGVARRSRTSPLTKRAHNGDHAFGDANGRASTRRRQR